MACFSFNPSKICFNPFEMIEWWNCIRKSKKIVINKNQTKQSGFFCKFLVYGNNVIGLCYFVYWIFIQIYVFLCAVFCYLISILSLLRYRAKFVSDPSGVVRVPFGCVSITCSNSQMWIGTKSIAHLLTLTFHDDNKLC